MFMFDFARQPTPSLTYFLTRVIMRTSELGRAVSRCSQRKKERRTEERTEQLTNELDVCTN
jgi:hypothetical protein